MLSIITVIPGFLAAWVGFKRSPLTAFLLVYMPAMLLLPEYYRWNAPGLPDPTFGQAAAVGTFIAFVWRGAPGYRFSITDLLVAGFALSASLSEYLASGYKDAQNLMFNMLAWVVIPYVLAKSLIHPFGMQVRFAKTMVLLLAGIAAVSIYEFHFAATPWRLVLDRFFPYQGLGWITTFRWGFARVAGPYGHAILAGILMVVGFRIQRWLECSQHWEPTPSFAKWLPIPQARVITLVLAAGVVMTLVRGPWIGAVLAALLVLIGRSHYRLLAITGTAALLLLAGIPAAIWFLDYVSVGRAGALTVSQETAAYRWELLSAYGDIAAAKLWLGWGLNDWPKVAGMPSIDNYFLLVYLMHGLLGLGFIVAILLSMPLRLLVRGMAEPLAKPAGSSLAFMLASLYAAFIVSLATVYLGLQAVPVLFLVTGWAEGYLRSAAGASAASPEAALGDVAGHGFRRVMA
jgi:hypothetical protein